MLAIQEDQRQRKIGRQPRPNSANLLRFCGMASVVYDSTAADLIFKFLQSRPGFPGFFRPNVCEFLANTAFFGKTQPFKNVFAHTVFYLHTQSFICKIDVILQIHTHFH